MSGEVIGVARRLDHVVYRRTTSSFQSFQTGLDTTKPHRRPHAERAGRHQEQAEQRRGRRDCRQSTSTRRFRRWRSSVIRARVGLRFVDDLSRRRRPVVRVGRQSLRVRRDCRHDDRVFTSNSGSSATSRERTRRRATSSLYWRAVLSARTTPRRLRSLYTVGGQATATERLHFTDSFHGRVVSSQ